jgi:hypothetical protein
MRASVIGVVFVFFVVAPSSARAETIEPSVTAFSAQPRNDPWQVRFHSESDDAAPTVPLRLVSFPSILLNQQDAQPLHAAAIEHSDAYLTRAKIHKVASLATLPLFAAELALGDSLYNTPTGAGGKRAAHAIVGSGIVGLFGVNTVTGAWNLFGEGWTETQGRTRRLVHGLLMMAADVGFLATTASAPNSGNSRAALTFETSKVTHRNLAIASISVGTAGYLLMLFGSH